MWEHVKHVGACGRQGGKEASRSNALLHRIIADAIEEVVPEVGRGLISLVQSREDIDRLLALDDVIDLVTLSRHF
jgi:delta-1-pyrroline-5-carboxylate synthetase